MYRTLGTIPHKRHTQFRRPDGGLHTEEVFGTEGFSGRQSILYHVNPPTAVREIEPLPDRGFEPWQPGVHRHHHLKTAGLVAGGDPVEGRRVFASNDEVWLSIALPTEPMAYFHRNALADELIFVHEGSGSVESSFGTLHYRPGDYLIIPRGTTYRIRMEGTSPQRHLVAEAFGTVAPASRYRNEFGQFLEHAPYCERDIRMPEQLATHDERGDFEVRVTLGRGRSAYRFDFHPLDVVGWDGYLYPWAFSIHDFEPITGRVHQPPPVHQTFQGPGFVVCSFVPRKLDYHPEAVPAPYHHSNVDSDELIYYANGAFSSRRGIERASITIHPRGLPHGPQPGAVEASLGRTETEELAVMIDTFRPLHLTTTAQSCDDPAYPRSWYRPV
ncbi:MAG: homogentisate 1,2-dioxygenase [Chloroflexi bacterium]|nr:homogentisate 1,2-dioxygenase [Chloroflexota bacterium]